MFSRRSWARPWRPSAPALRRRGPAIAVIGNCQARGVAQSIELLVPDCRATLLPLARLRRDHASLASLARALADFDHVFTQHIPSSFLPPGDAARLEALPSRVVFPTIVFPAFHPDVVYVGDVSKLAVSALVPSPLGYYHSAIVLFAFLCGLDERETLALFDEPVFAGLGYLDGWEGAASDLLRTAADVSFDLGTSLLRWTRRGTFMHVLNHPRLQVLGDIARLLLDKAGVPANALVPEDYLPDELAKDVIWPVYGPIAERYGVPGSLLFKTRVSGQDAPTIYDLASFVAASFAIYRRVPPDSLSCPRMEAWRPDPRVRELFGASAP